MEKRTLLQRYDIPISHLDFKYIETCKNVKEMEKIVAILRSGEEGYYPDLTKCAENKLKELNPQSHALRTEDPLLTKKCFSPKDWQEHNAPISEWSSEIKNQDNLLSEIQKNLKDLEEFQYPPIRKGGKVNSSGTVKDKTDQEKSNKSAPGSTNYGQWDKYDADAEILKMDLEEERDREEAERLKRMNEKNSAKTKAIVDDDKVKMYDKLSKVEKEKLAEDFKIRGNEYFKSKEYENALKQYTRCIEILPTAAGYNNRSVTNLKLSRYSDALSDSNECLKLDKNNVKAWLRKAEAYLGMGLKHDAFRTYEEVKLIEPTNTIACHASESLRKELGEIAPIHATRLQIMDSNTTVERKPSQHKQIVPQKPQQLKQEKPPRDYDLAELIKPNKIVKNSLMKTMESLGKATPKPAPNTQDVDKKPNKVLLQNVPPEIKLNFDRPPQRSANEVLIQEI